MSHTDKPSLIFGTFTDKERTRLEIAFSNKTERLGECIIWTGKKNHKGYGSVMVRGKRAVASRVFFELYKTGLTPSLFVLHKCDNPSCVNPDHLFLGDQHDNIMDMINKDRKPKGERLSNSKLNKTQIDEILKLRSSGVSICSISKKFSVSRALIRRIVRGSAWKHIDRSLVQPISEESAKLCWLRGSGCHKAKITESDALKIRRMRSEGMTFQSLSDIFGITRSSIRNICIGKTWSHVKSEV